MKNILYILLFVNTAIFSQTTSNNNQNYVHSISYQVPLSQTEVELLANTASENNKKIETITYYDGLGRPKQNIAIRTGGNQQDLVTPIYYDATGRQPKDYLPYPVSSNNGAYIESVLNPLLDYYDTNFSNTPSGFGPTPTGTPSDINPYSEKRFEASPLNRVVELGAPGKDWEIDPNQDTDHTIKMDYKTNTASEVLQFQVNFIGGDTEKPSLYSAGNYAANQLYKTITKDENWTGGKNHTTQEFKNKQGQIVLKRTFTLNTVSNLIPTVDNTIAQNTYYVYDDFGNLTYVLPPAYFDPIGLAPLIYDLSTDEVVLANEAKHLEAIESITLLPGFGTELGSDFSATIVPDDSDTPLNAYGYQYKYDYRNRLIEKKIPGKGWEYIVYNKLDKPILTQDALMRLENKWLFTKYDAFGRVVYTGIYTDATSSGVNGATRSELQKIASEAETNSEKSMDETPQYFFEIPGNSTINNKTISYTNRSFPKENLELLTVNYYDNYNFTIPSELTYTDAFGQTLAASTQSLPTASLVRVLGTDDWITGVTYYDEKARPIFIGSKNEYLNTTDIVKSELDFVGKVFTSESTHTKDNNAPIIVSDYFTYDHMGRLNRQTQSINGGSTELIVDNLYNELGQLIRKNVGGIVSEGFGPATDDPESLQKVDYKYNIRGWLTDINDVDENASDDLFQFRISYNHTEHNMDGVTTPLYNGNISQTIWKTQNTDTNKRSYDYQYDGLNRIRSATGRMGGDLDALTDFNIEGINYDKNGNILSLRRFGTPDDGSSFLWDDLSYAYTGNKLKGVSDIGALEEGFKDGNTSPTDYFYDENGNMITDLNKGISSITYNHLNLPESISINNGTESGNITYIYDATGVKLEKVLNQSTPNSQETKTQYASNYIYKQEGIGSSALQFFHQAEGYVQASGSGGFEYVYQHKDHLGNIRLAYSDSDGNGDIATTEILEENNYYPFGLKHKGYNEVVNGTNHPYGFGGKEEQEELGLGWIDITARNYDAALGRWMNVDPLADKMRNNSPYNYAFNNPVLFVDPDGMFPIIIHVRSFAPFKNFGPGMAWSGDDRGFSTNPNEKSRLHQISNYETDTGISSHLTIGAFSSSSYGAWAYSDAYYKDYSSRGNINTHMYGNNDAVFPPGTFGPMNIIPYDGGPTWDIDVHTNLDINVSDIDGGNQLLTISGQISGDEFPNAEAYVSDANGNSVFLGVFVTQSGPQEGPTTTLFGDKNNPMMKINMGIETDKNGIFTGVRIDGKTISIEEWNKNSSGPMSVEEFKKKHGDYYNQLFGDK